MGRSTTIKNDKELKICDRHRFGFTYTTFSLKFREENKAGLMFWTGPGVPWRFYVCECILVERLWRYSSF